MRRVSAGYTIVEILIFLAVSSFLLTVSLIYLSGREDSARFSQSMRDLQSNVQDWLNDVPTGFPGGSNAAGAGGQFHCVSLPPRQRIDAGAANPSVPNQNSADCIYLGKALQFTDKADTTNDSKVFVYSVFGSRLSSSGSGDLSANLVDSGPFPAVGSGVCGNCTGTADLTQTYTLEGGATVLSVKSDNSGDATGKMPADSHLAGFYLSLNQSSNSTNGNADTVAYQYPISGNLPAANSGGPSNSALDCLRFSTGSPCNGPPLGLTQDQWPPRLKNWYICLTDGIRTSLLTISSSNGQGVTTSLDYKVCS